MVITVEHPTDQIHAPLSRAAQWDWQLDKEWLADFFDAHPELTQEVGPQAGKDDRGTPYVALTIGGVKPEGAPSLLQLVTHEYAGIKYGMDRLGDEIIKWLAGRTHIVWRQKPYANFDRVRAETGYPGGEELQIWHFRCRLTAY